MIERAEAERAEAAFEHHNPETFECSSKIFREVNRITPQSLFVTVSTSSIVKSAHSCRNRSCIITVAVNFF